MSETARPTVALFVTCLVDLLRPTVGFATVQLLEDAGCVVEVPDQQTCCGQPGYNSGGYDDARRLARRVIEQFSDYDYVVAPSGSCAGMIRHHYPRLFDEQPEWQARARALGERTWELTSFLVDVMNYQPDTAVPLPGNRHVTYHDSCAGLREMSVREQPRALLKQMRGIELDELQGTEVCCGFGGTFCAKMPELSTRMVSDKLESALATEADMLLGGDLGCLFHIAGRASRLGQAIETRHVAEVLADRLDVPAIGEGES
jgi:L-lactate dehydrogenase complex protein LldE